MAEEHPATQSILHLADQCRALDSRVTRTPARLRNNPHMAGRYHPGPGRPGPKHCSKSAPSGHRSATPPSPAPRTKAPPTTVSPTKNSSTPPPWNRP